MTCCLQNTFRGLESTSQRCFDNTSERYLHNIRQVVFLLWMICVISELTVHVTSMLTCSKEPVMIYMAFIIRFTTLKWSREHAHCWEEISFLLGFHQAFTSHMQVCSPERGGGRVGGFCAAARMLIGLPSISDVWTSKLTFSYHASAAQSKGKKRHLTKRWKIPSYIEEHHNAYLHLHSHSHQI